MSLVIGQTRIPATIPRQFMLDAIPDDVIPDCGQIHCVAAIRDPATWEWIVGWVREDCE